MALIVDGNLTIPLYHGTSDLFYDSIKEFGLGGRNLIKELRVVELLRQLLAICQTSLPNDEEWLVRMQGAEWVSQQGVSPSGLNFRHGSTYLTPSRYTAANYATVNEYGSEVLECFMMLWNRLHESHVELSEEVADSAQTILDFVARTRTPIMIRLDDVPTCSLSAENGREAATVFQRLESFMNDKVSFPLMCQQANFELLQPIRIRESQIFRIMQPPSDPEKEPLLAPYNPGQ